MSPIKKNRFSFSKEPEFNESDRELKKNRLRFTSSGKINKYKPIIIIVSVAVVAIIAALIITSIYKKPKGFLSGKDPVENESIIFDGKERALPEGEIENLHLKRGKESFHKGYFNDALAEFSQVLESDASDKEKAMALTYTGIIHDEKGDYKQAIESFNRALVYDRKNPIIYRNLSLTYRHMKQYEKAGKYAGKALDLDTDNAKSHILMGNIQYEQGKYSDAVREYEKALKIEPENSRALYNLGISLLKSGDEIAAIDNLKRAASADKLGEVAKLANAKLGLIFMERGDLSNTEKYMSMAKSVAPSDPVQHYNLGIIYLKQNKPEMALTELQKAEELGRQDTEVLESLGEAYFSMRKYDKSIGAYEKALSLNQRNVKILSRIAELYYKKGELDKAHDYYKKITTLEPASENARFAYLNMGNILDDAQRFDEAINAYNKSLAINPKDTSALLNLGIAYKHAGKPQLAIQTWRKAADMDLDDPKALMAIADYYYENDYFDQAMDEYQTILRRWPGIQDGHFNLAAIYYKKNLLDYAMEEYKKVIEINDKNELARKAYINLGVLQSKKGETDETMEKSMAYVQKALLLKPGDADALFSLGLIYYKKEMLDKAIDTFFQAISSTTDSKLLAESYNNIGKCYYKKGRYKKALNYFTRGIEEDPSNEEIRMNRKVAMQAYEAELSRR